MPWHIEHRDQEWCVIKDADGENEGCHPTEAEAQRHMAALYANTTDAEAVAGLTFDEADTAWMAATFTADQERRTVTGLILPWGKVAKAAFSRWRFSRGSLHWSDVSRVKLDHSHDRKDAVGVAVRLQDTPLGLSGSFRIANGQRGDEALALAADGVLDGFSAEVDFDEDAGDGWREASDGVRDVFSARLTGAALTGFPAFDDARITRIAAMREGGVMPDKDGAVELDESAPAASFETAMDRLAEKVTASQQDLMKSVGDSINAGMKVALENMATPQGGPEPVRAARYQITREEPVYRFNGTGHSLVRDAWYAQMEQDADAQDRITRYRRMQNEMAELVNHQLFGQVGESMLTFAPQTTGTASQIIPPGYRPDLYVSDLFRGRPLVNAASHGTIDNATPFTVPVFGSVTGATADHTEGTNPSDGSLAFATKTVTPQAISGRLTLSREIVDSSNPAIDQIAFQEMRESYARQTEAKVYALLNGASGAGGTISLGFVPSGAQAATYVGSTGTPPALIAGIRARLAAYPFARFASPTAALMGQNATTILATATDSTGRPIFPSVGPSNTSGVGSAYNQGWDVDGLAFVPAWANTGVAAGDSQIMILNRSDLWVWESPLLTFRFEEKQGPANIELNVFGYFATHLLRPVGLSGIRIT